MASRQANPIIDISLSLLFLFAGRSCAGVLVLDSCHFCLAIQAGMQAVLDPCHFSLLFRLQVCLRAQERHLCTCRHASLASLICSEAGSSGWLVGQECEGKCKVISVYICYFLILFLVSYLFFYLFPCPFAKALSKCKGNSCLFLSFISVTVPVCQAPGPGHFLVYQDCNF